MTREQQLSAAEDHERRAARVRARFGLQDDPHQDRVREWLHSSGAVPAAIAVLVIVGYVVLVLIKSLFGS
ncbi:hypothetical protein [Microlunatus ginsengisoli]|uniref:DUF3040 domain-containing protein n=1 Tax=Microlunatus ginsengisoli TaxID=363863 RepID=A0ABP7AF23_9ACTN